MMNRVPKAKIEKYNRLETLGNHNRFAKTKHWQKQDQILNNSF